MDKSNVLMQKYEVEKRLGQGSFATVYRARNLETNQTVAIKVMKKEKIVKLGLEARIEREISNMRMLEHPNIVEIYEVMASKTTIYIVMEYAEGGTLYRRMKETGGMKEREARKYFQQLITAVDFCHKSGVYHRDLKPDNLLLDENGVLKVADFGLSALVESKIGDALLHTRCGTPRYLSPELLCRRAYDGAKADIWSCGVILYELLAGRGPFDDTHEILMYKNICRADYKCPRWFSNQVKPLLKGIFQLDPNERFSVSKIMRSSWFQRELNLETISKVEELLDADECDNSQENVTPKSLTAFDLISRLSGFESDFSSEDLISRLRQKDTMAKKSVQLTSSQSVKNVRFTSPQSATSIMEQLKKITRKLKLNVKKEGSSLKLEQSTDNMMKRTLSIEAEIFEFSSSCRLVEMKMSNGDTFEFRKIVEDDIRPALKDVVWACQGESSNSNSSICV